MRNRESRRGFSAAVQLHERQREIIEQIPAEWRINASLPWSERDPMSLPERSGILSVLELEITESSATNILGKIRCRRWSATQVTLAFCKRAAIAHQAVNCVSEFMFDEALRTAHALDDYMAEHNKTIGPLHGLPISIKEHIELKGSRATAGLWAWADFRSQEDSVVVHMLRRQGAIFHVKTTNPQLIMALETDSNLFGRTLNPHNTTLTCGGSSGGEAALICLRGSVVGIGADIGGSIRVPSGFCGLYGLKPSVARLPHGGLRGLHAGMENIIGCVGPMATSLADLQLICDSILACQPSDIEPGLIEMPWKRDVHMPGRLRVGILWHDGVVAPHPPIRREMLRVQQALQRAGHSTFEWEPVEHKQLAGLIDELYFLDGGEEYFKILKSGNENAVPIMQWLLDSKASKTYKVQETWKINTIVDKLRSSHLSRWISSDVDVLLTPVNASLASGHDESRYWGYSSVYNLLDLPAVAFPTGVINSADTWTSYPAEQKHAMSPIDGYYRQLYDEYGPEKYVNAPVSLQLVGRRLREEELLRALEIVERALAGGKYGQLDLARG
ncbi:unnamed protein product [Cercospora beticola]|nr:unnamed protein product [Cercospora beticola]